MSNQSKICFIYCVSDYRLVFKSLKTVNSLIIPEGYTIERRIVQNADCLTDGYNQGMLSSDAKYKVYLHQDVMIVNRGFLSDTLTLFKIHPFLGMIGVAGSKIVPSNGIWWESPICFGKVWWGNPQSSELLAFGETSNDYESVKVIDGLIMITQYDLPWRTDLFRGWHFYDVSQSLEFIKKGYQVGVPRQTEPWCLHIYHNVNANGYDSERQIFIKEYANFIGK